MLTPVGEPLPKRARDETLRRVKGVGLQLEQRREAATSDSSTAGSPETSTISNQLLAHHSVDLVA
eukprot:9467312-Pyramimonas_sp.AAC.1